MENLKSYERAWDFLANGDPFFTVLGCKNAQGEILRGEPFFSTGSVEIDRIFYRLSRLDPEYPNRAALDFGCGLGRLSRALATRYAQTVGVDISYPMVRMARKLNRGIRGLEFVHNPQFNLSLFEDESFDCIVSLLTLQHMSPKLIQIYLNEFGRIIRPGGWVIFQLPIEELTMPHKSEKTKASSSHFQRLVDTRNIWGRIKRTLLQQPLPCHFPCNSIFGESPETVRSTTAAHQVHLIALEPDERAGPEWKSALYFAQKSKDTTKKHH